MSGALLVGIVAERAALEVGTGPWPQRVCCLFPSGEDGSLLQVSPWAGMRWCGHSPPPTRVLR